MAVGSECYSLKSRSMLITENFPPSSFFPSPSLLFHSFFPPLFSFPLSRALSIFLILALPPHAQLLFFCL